MGDSKSATVVVPGFLADNAVIHAIQNAYDSFSERRASLGLSYPGTVENIAREVQKDVFLTNSMFTGLRADFTKPLGINPLFQYTHAFSMGAQGIPPYNFSALFGNAKIFLQGSLDNDGQLMARGNYRWNSLLTTKCQAQIAPGAGQGMLQIDNEVTGADFSASLKSINPSIIEGGLTGIFVGSYLQALTPGLAVGFEAMWQRVGLSSGPETILSYCGKYKGSDWVASAQLQAQGGLNTSFWRKLGERVEAGVDLNLQIASSANGGGLMLGGSRKEAITTLGAKYDFRAATFRAQVDSSGKVSCLLERRVLPPIQLTFAGEMDHAKSQAKIGLAVSIEAASEDLMLESNNAAAPPSVPF